MYKADTLRRRPALLRKVLLGEEEAEVKIRSPEDVDLLEELGVLRHINPVLTKSIISKLDPDRLRKLVPSLRDERLSLIVSLGDRGVAKKLLTNEWYTVLYIARKDLPEREAREMIDKIDDSNLLSPLILASKGRRAEPVLRKAKELDLSEDEKRELATLMVTICPLAFVRKHFWELRDWGADLEPLLSRTSSERTLKRVLRMIPYEDKLTLLNSSSSYTILRRLAQDEDPRIRSLALSALGALRSSRCELKEV